MLEDGESVAREAHSTEELPEFAKLRAQWELEQDHPQAAQMALDAAERVIMILRKTGERDSGPFAMRALALARLNRPADAWQSLQEGSVGMEYSLYAAQTYIALGEPERARESVREAYELAWDDGPPYAYHWYLERCRKILKQLGEPEPQLPPFNPAKVEKLPHEEEILAAIEKLKKEKKSRS
jgi:tetratricopeptide (TPR) repeat protein